MDSSMVAAVTRLNRQQREAVFERSGPVMVIAGAGSGKTSTMTVRMGVLWSEGVAPEKIIGLTFTNKAANEMKERIGRLIGQPEIASKMTLSTFHSFGVRILREFPEEVGRRPGFSILNANDQERVWKEILQNANLDVTKAMQLYQPMISRWKNNGWHTSKIVQSRVTPRSKTEAQELHVGIQLMRQYENELSRLNAFDFDDLILRPYLLFLERDDLRKVYQNRYEYWHVDEYQDTNLVQFQLLKQLVPKSGQICVVGDPSQSLYRWRGSDDSNWQNFMDSFPNYKLIRLFMNYRSRKRILDSANRLIGFNEAIVKNDLDSAREDGQAPVLKITSGEAFDYGDAIVDDIKQKMAEGYSYQDFAILMRTRTYFRQIEYALQKNGIPYSNQGVQSSLFETPFIRSLLAYMNLLENGLNELTMLKVLNVPERFIGPVSIQVLREFAEREGISLWEALQRAVEVRELRQHRTRKGIEQFVSVIDTLREKKVEWVDNGEMIADVLEGIEQCVGLLNFFKSEHRTDSGYEKHLQDTFDLFLQITREFTQEFYSRESRYPEWREYLDFVSLGSVSEGSSKEDVVRLMTIHASKGLEFPVVYLPFLVEGELPHKNIYKMKTDAEVKQALAEERRVAYVALTRAKDHLVIMSDGSSSTFIDELSTTITRG